MEFLYAFAGALAGGLLSFLGTLIASRRATAAEIRKLNLTKATRGDALAVSLFEAKIEAYRQIGEALADLANELSFMSSLQVPSLVDSAISDAKRRISKAVTANRFLCSERPLEIALQIRDMHSGSIPRPSRLPGYTSVLLPQFSKAISRYTKEAAMALALDRLNLLAESPDTIATETSKAEGQIQGS